jgi:ATP-binding cassette subfamily B protein
VRDNLTLFNRTIDDVRIQMVLQAVGMWRWIERLPHGLDTPIGAGGEGLSAGESQLLAFGRVFLRDPGVILLDEASSRLDPATERLLERAVDQLLSDRTGIIIAHRLHTVQRADTIMILEHGEIVEYGPRAQLAADPHSRLSALLQTDMEELVT